MYELATLWSFNQQLKGNNKNYWTDGDVDADLLHVFSAFL